MALAVTDDGSGESIVIGIRLRFCGHTLVEVFIDGGEFGQCKVGPQRCVRQDEREGGGGLARQFHNEEGVGQGGPEREALHAVEQREADVEHAFHGFTQAHVDEHQGAEPDECYPCHDGLRGEGECHDIGCRDAARHVAAVHVGCLHESCVLRHGDGATARRSGKGGGEVLGEDLALGAAGAAVLRHVEHGALCLDGDVELCANEAGVFDGVGHIHGRLDAGIHTEWLTKAFSHIGCEHLRGCTRALGCYVNHKFKVFEFRPSSLRGAFHACMIPLQR